MPPPASPQLSQHFHLDEFTVSQEATRRGLDNTPTPPAMRGLLRLAALLEDVRVLLGEQPISISSGYRSPAVNKAVGGSPKSAHLAGLAADFVCPGYGTPLQVCQEIAGSGIAFDQLIYEGTWVHIGLAPVGAVPRREVLTARFLRGAPVQYLRGLVA